MEDVQSFLEWHAKSTSLPVVGYFGRYRTSPGVPKARTAGIASQFPPRRRLTVVLPSCGTARWCRPGIAEGSRAPRSTSMKVPPEGPAWKDVHRYCKVQKVQASDYSRSGNSVSVGLLWIARGEYADLFSTTSTGAPKSRRQYSKRGGSPLYSVASRCSATPS